MNHKSGFGLIEIVVGVAIIATALMVIITVIINLNHHQRQATQQIQARFLAVEGLEALRHIRDNDWLELANLNFGEDYGLVWVDGWEIAAESTTALDGFTRTIDLESVRRNTQGQIDSTGEIDDNTILATVTITWSGIDDDLNQQSIQTYLTNMFKHAAE